MRLENIIVVNKLSMKNILSLRSIGARLQTSTVLPKQTLKCFC